MFALLKKVLKSRYFSNMLNYLNYFAPIKMAVQLFCMQHVSMGKGEENPSLSTPCSSNPPTTVCYLIVNIC